MNRCAWVVLLIALIPVLFSGPFYNFCYGCSLAYFYFTIGFRTNHLPKSDPAKTILVTGAMGYYGKLITARLSKDHPDYTIIASDMKDAPSDPTFVWGPNPSNVHYIQIDLAFTPNQALIFDVVGRAHYVLHLGSYPGSTMLGPTGVRARQFEMFQLDQSDFPPSMPKQGENYEYYCSEKHCITPEQLFKDNVEGCQHIFDAAIHHRVKRVVYASTAFAYGFAHDSMDFHPHYFPIDEEHPLLPLETYGLSKKVSEHQIEMSIRAGAIGSNKGAPWKDGGGTSFVSFRWPNSVWEEYWHLLPWPAPQKKNGYHGGPIMWAYVYAGDVEEAFVRGAFLPEEKLTQSGGKSDVFLLAADDIRVDDTTMNLIEHHWKGRAKPEIRAPMPGHKSFLNNSKATRVLGMKFRSFHTDFKTWSGLESRTSVEGV